MASSSLQCSGSWLLLRRLRRSILPTLSIPPPHRGWPTIACRRRPQFEPASKWRSSANSRRPRKPDRPGAASTCAWGALASLFAFARRGQGSTSTPRPRTCWLGYSPQSASNSSRAETFAERIVGWRTKAKASANANAAAGANGAGGGANAASANANAAGSDANAAGANANPAGADASLAGAGGTEDKAAKEDKLYNEQHMPYPPRHAPFDNALELSLLPGISLAVVERVLPLVTVFSGRADVDVSSADPTVLSALPKMTPQILGAVLNARVSDPGDGRALLELLGPAKSHATVEASKAFRASIAVDFDNGRHVHAEVVFRLKDQGDAAPGGKDQGGKDQGKEQGGNDQNAKDQDAEPYELLYWRDDFDGPMQSA